MITTYSGVIGAVTLDNPTELPEVEVDSMELAMGSRSTFLFARPSFSEGAARLVDWSGMLNVYARWDDPDEADAAAISADWGAVHDELAHAAAKSA